MEKQRIKSVTKSCRRLLISGLFGLLFSVNLFSQNLTAAEINRLRIVPVESQNLYTKTDVKLFLSIPNIKPSQIQILSNPTQPDVYFKTMKKSEDFENGGTLLEFWYNFDKAGTYQLEQLPVIIQNRRRFIKFQSLKIEEDPSKQNPRIVIQFENGTTIFSDNGVYEKPVLTAKVGQKINFTVNLQFATQLVQFTWDLPKDSIFKQTQAYEITEVKYREKKPSNELIPVASFEWTALTSGSHVMPKIKLVATGYNGYKNELLMPETKLNFTDETIFSNENANDRIFDAAFSTQYANETSSSSIKITEEDCKNLAKLYSKERNSIFTHHGNKKSRQNFERNLSLPVNQNRDYSLGQLIGSVLFLLGATIILIISIREKKHFRILISSALILIATVPLLYAIIKGTEQYGICTGCTIYSIPEENAEASSEIGAGNKVHITEITDEWMYIQLGETGGWCNKENIIIIK